MHGRCGCLGGVIGDMSLSSSEGEGDRENDGEREDIVVIEDDAES